MPVFITPGPSASRGLGPHGNPHASYVIALTDIPRLKDMSVSQG